MRFLKLNRSDPSALSLLTEYTFVIRFRSVPLHMNMGETLNQLVVDN